MSVKTVFRGICLWGKKHWRAVVRVAVGVLCFALGNRFGKRFARPNVNDDTGDSGGVEPDLGNSDKLTGSAGREAGEAPLNLSQEALSKSTELSKTITLLQTDLHAQKESLQSFKNDTQNKLDEYKQEISGKDKTIFWMKVGIMGIAAVSGAMGVWGYSNTLAKIASGAVRWCVCVGWGDILLNLHINNIVN